MTSASSARTFDVRHVQLARAAVHLVTHGLPVTVYDQFVPAVEAVTPEAVTAVARDVLLPDTASVVVVGDAERCRGPLESLGWPVVMTTPSF